MSRLQKKPPAHKRGHPTLQNMNFFYFCESFLPSWIRIRILIPNTDPGPLARLNTDPDPKPCFKYISHHGSHRHEIIKQCCGSGMFIPGPDFYPSRIPDLGSRILDPGSKNSNERRGWKKIWYHTFFWSHKFHKIELFYFWNDEEKIIELFTQKIVTKLSKIWVWDPRSGIRKNLFRIPDPGVKKAPDPGSATL